MWHIYFHICLYVAAALRDFFEAPFINYLTYIILQPLTYKRKHVYLN